MANHQRQNIEQSCLNRNKHWKENRFWVRTNRWNISLFSSDKCSLCVLSTLNCILACLFRSMVFCWCSMSSFHHCTSLLLSFYLDSLFSSFFFYILFSFASWLIVIMCMVAFIYKFSYIFIFMRSSEKKKKKKSEKSNKL